MDEQEHPRFELFELESRGAGGPRPGALRRTCALARCRARDSGSVASMPPLVPADSADTVCRAHYYMERQSLLSHNNENRRHETTRRIKNY